MSQPSEPMPLSELRELVRRNPDAILRVHAAWLLALSEDHSRLLDAQRVPSRPEQVDGASEG